MSNLSIKKWEIFEQAEHLGSGRVRFIATREDLRKLLSSSLDKYALAIAEEVEGTDTGAYHHEDYVQGFNAAKDRISSIIKESISK